jgi:hypothetical protein
VSLLSPVATIVGVVAAFFFGRLQGRIQSRYTKSAEIVTELRRCVLEIQSELEALANAASSPERPKKANSIVNKVSSFGFYYETHEPWLTRKLRDKATPIVHELYAQTYGLLRDEGPQDAASTLQFVANLRRIKNSNLQQLLDDFTEETERLLGTAPPWWRRCKSKQLPPPAWLYWPFLLR